MSALCLSKAIRLYQLLEYYLPVVTPEQTVLEFVSGIVYNIIATNNHKVYLTALALMQDTTLETIVETYAPEESIAEFSRGLQDNQILLLQSFCKHIGI